jgi:hypothetical protein
VVFPCSRAGVRRRVGTSLCQVAAKHRASCPGFASRRKTWFFPAPAAAARPRWHIPVPIHAFLPGPVAGAAGDAGALARWRGDMLGRLGILGIGMPESAGNRHRDAQNSECGRGKSMPGRGVHCPDSCPGLAAGSTMRAAGSAWVDQAAAKRRLRSRAGGGPGDGSATRRERRPDPGRGEAAGVRRVSGSETNVSGNKACQTVLKPTCEVSFKLLIHQWKFPSFFLDSPRPRD